MVQNLPADRNGRAREEGSTLVEILIAFLVLLILMLGVLQMFSVSFLLNKGSGSRTEMTYKAQQLVENIRLLNTLYKKGTTLPSDVASWFPMSAGATHDLSGLSGSDLVSSYWGPSQADIVETANASYALSVSVADGGASWAVTVTAKPNPAPGATKYIGGVGKRKGIEYVFQVPK